MRLAHFHLPDKYQDKNALMGCSMMPYLSSSCRNNQATIVHSIKKSHPPHGAQFTGDYFLLALLFSLTVNDGF